MESNQIAQFFLENGPIYGTLIVGFISGFIPIVNMELYLIALVSLVSPMPQLWFVGMLAGLGQVGAKTMIYYASQGSLNLKMPKKLDPEKVESLSKKFISNTYKGDLIMVASAFVGLPPILITSFVAGFARYPVVKFVLIAFGGRWLRFYLCLLFPEFIKNKPW